jgi:hypothetical protein
VKNCGQDFSNKTKIGRTREEFHASNIAAAASFGTTAAAATTQSNRSQGESGYIMTQETFLTDAVAEFTKKAHRAALEISYPTFGFALLTIDELLGAIRKVAGKPA